MVNPFKSNKNQERKSHEQPNKRSLSSMEFFNKAKAVRLRSHLDKYLVADDDEQTVRQSRNGSSHKARWTVEIVEGKSHVIHLKSCHGRYLTASDEPFLLSVTGKKVLQTIPATMKDNSIEWEPIKDGFLVKLRTKGGGGKFLRANWGTPPWRNSVTHDVPYRTATQDWVLWEVEMVDTSILESSDSLSSCDSLPGSMSSASSFSSALDDITGFNTGSPSMNSDGSKHASRRQNGMEFFDKAKAVRLQSHLGKYLVADDNEETVRQSRNGSSRNARWTVEFIEGNNRAIRLKSFHGNYLTATDDPFLLGWTGKKVVQTIPAKDMNNSIEWEPIKDGFKLKLRSWDGKFLRANGGTPPWRNSITHDVPNRTATQDWVLWGVDVVDISVSESESLSTYISPASSFSSLVDDYMDSPDNGSPMLVSGRTDYIDSPENGSPMIVSGRTDYIDSPENGSPMIVSGRSGNVSGRQSGMDFFRKAKTVRLRSHHGKYLIAEDDQESVTQERNGSTKNARWTVEFVKYDNNVVRLKSCYGRYLTACNEEFLLGVTGRKVLQTMPRKLDSAVDWEPIRDGVHVKLKSPIGNFLRANGGFPPMRNSVTHDIPYRHMDWILWDVNVLELRPDSPQRKPQPKLEHKPLARASSVEPESSSAVYKHKPVSRAASVDSESSSAAYKHKPVSRAGSVDSESTPASYNHRPTRSPKVETKLAEEHKPVPQMPRNDSLDSESNSGSFHLRSPRLSGLESSDSFSGSSVKSEGRVIYYNVADDNGGVEDGNEAHSFNFKGHGLEELTQKLEEETGLKKIIVCSRNPLNGQLYPLHLALPPNNATMRVVVVPPTSQVARDLCPETPAST